MKAGLLCAAALACPPAAALAQEEGADSNSFSLGQIIVTGKVPESGVGIGSDMLTTDAMERFNRVTLDDAVNLIPGVTSANSGGSRNERLIFVRGFDRFQVPLSIDGIRVYLPADNRLDFGRFLTPDVAEVQVAKGYASVLDGPGAMGGAINLVTRRPTHHIDAEVRGTLNLDRDADYGGYTVFALLGTRRDKWYAQASYTRNVTDHWTLPGGFRATTANEDGGERDFSGTQDWRVNVKAGFTPNITDEYSISYTRQEGSKNAPLHVTDNVANASLRNWSWPYWNIESVYFLSSTWLSDEARLKTRAFHSNYDNLLSSWDNRNQNSQLLNRAFNSPYADTAYGGSAELAVDLLPAYKLSIAFHYRYDEHSETQTSHPGVAGATPEPLQTSAERNYSMAAEHRWQISPHFALTAGVSYEWRDLDRAEEFGVPPGGSGANRLFEFALADTAALNGQGRLDWDAEDDTHVYASVSSRTRFPTLFERFSSQFGTAVPNPNLRPERATNFEVGGDKRFGLVKVAGALFVSRLDDALVSVRVAGNRNQRTNIGSADYAGGEISVEAQLGSSVSLGANYSYIHRSFDIGTAPAGGFIRQFQLTDVPNHKGIVYAQWIPMLELEILPSVEFVSDRTTVTPATANNDMPVYYKTGSNVLANLTINYDVSESVRVGIGMRNAFDELYQLADGFPEPGRSFFLTAKARY